MMYNFRLRSTVSRNSSVDPRDTLSTKRALSTLGHYSLQKNLEQYGITDFVDEGMFDGIRSFQRQKGLKEDGLMRKGGPTERMLDTSLSAVTRQRQKAIKQRLDQIRKPDTARPDQRRKSLTEQRREFAQSREKKDNHKISSRFLSHRFTEHPPETNLGSRKPPKPRPAPPDRGSDVFGAILDALGVPTLEEKREQQEEQGGWLYPHYPQPPKPPRDRLGDFHTVFVPEPIGRGGKNPNSKGTQLVKTALTMLGYAFDDKRRSDKDDDGTDLGFAIENLQRDFNLKRDGYLIPGGETAKKIAELITPMAHQSREGSFSNWLASLVKGAHAKSPENNATKSVIKKNQSDEEDYVLPPDIRLPEPVKYSEDDIKRYSPTQEMKDSIRRKGESSIEYKLRTQVNWDGVSDPKAKQAIRRIILLEGGYSNDPNDPGGETNYGVSQRLLDRFHNKPEFEKFRKVLPENAKDITPAHAAFVYNEYFVKQSNVNLNTISEAIGNSEEAHNLYALLLDTSVNQGEKQAGVIAQQTLDYMLPDEPSLRIKEEGKESYYDGHVGEQTIGKLKKALKGEYKTISEDKIIIMNNTAKIIRDNIYRKTSGYGVYGKGWGNRNESFYLPYRTDPIDRLK